MATSDGKLIAGIRVRQTDHELVLRDAEDREVVIPTRAIEEQKPGGSLMPAGLTDALTRAELVDLVRFLTELGKIGPYCRQQRSHPPPLASPHADFRGAGACSTAPAWMPSSTKTVHWSGAPSTRRSPGCCRCDDVPAVSRGAGRPPIALARSQLEVSHPGRVKLSFNSALGLTFWMDGRRIEPTADRADELICDLTTGLHTLSLAILTGSTRAGDSVYT